MPPPCRIAETETGLTIELPEGADAFELRYAVSLISPEEAAAHLARELPEGTTFDAVAEALRDAWTECAGTIETEGGTDAERAVFYTALILNNKFLKDLPDDDLVIAQLGVAALLTLPYVLATEDVASFSLDWTGLAALLAIGILHTTIGCKLYFTSLTRLSAQRIAIFSYLDPVVAIFLSVVVLGEAMTVSAAVGAVLILGAALLSETVGRKPAGKESN